MKKSIKRNYIYNTFYQALTLVIPFITAPYIARVLGADGIGSASYAESIVSYFTLFATMGISTYGQREISYVQDDLYRRSVVFWNTKLLSFFTSSVMLAVYIAFAFCQQARVIYLILSLNILSVLFDVTWFFQGMEEFGRIVLRNTIIRLVQTIYIFVFVRSKDDLVLYVLGLSLFQVFGNLSLWFYLKRYLVKVPRGEIHPFRDIRTVWSLFVPAIAISIYTVLDKTMIGLITGDSFENGYYELAIRISKMALTLVTALGTVLMPRIGFYYRKDDREKIQSIMYRSSRFVWFLGIPLCLGLGMVAENFVLWFFGPEYEKVIPLLRVLSLLILAIGFSNIVGGQYLVPTKRQNTMTMTVLVGAVVNFSLNMLLIRPFLAAGAAVASVAAETAITGLQLFLVRKELSAWRMVKEGAHYYVAGLVMVLVLWPLCRILSPSLIHTTVLVLTGAATYFLALTVQRDAFFLTNVQTVLQKLRYPLK